ncbi:hypothetical protein PR003_g1145 [Phytophthora rubi]|uniref:Uncharacterized protein n=1 Tax=Phytophthora rubi TaxID=129364 RepID=A0A6A3PGT5_9STRA|nr:hypothetical protein PR001_g1002 [Phytophthora rubi]KAE9358687.1 hypothetical protein PR003_g1145 [Phytophthora rubi]
MPRERRSKRYLHNVILSRLWWALFLGQHYPHGQIRLLPGVHPLPTKIYQRTTRLSKRYRRGLRNVSNTAFLI